jgi:RLL motif-containing protein 1
MLARKLQALAFEQWRGFDVGDVQHVRALVAWLEDKKIRALDLEKRGPLRDRTSPSWNDSFAAYLGELGCPKALIDELAAASFAGQPLIVVLDWLLGEAIGMEYHESGEHAPPP